MQVFRSMILDAEIDRVWDAVRAFDGVATWNPGVVHASLETGAPTATGSIRTLQTPDGAVFRETLLAHSDLEYFYSYDIVEGPLPCSNYISTHRFIEITDGDKTLGIWQGEFDCDPSDAADLETIVGDLIYRDGQRGLNQLLQETQA